MINNRIKLQAARLGTFFFAMLITTVTFAQEFEQEPTYNKSIGIDASFINNFLPLENNIGIRGPHLFHYIKYKANNKFIRQALNFNIMGNFQQDNSGSNSKSTQFFTSYKISKGKSINVLKRVNALYGAEISLNYIFSAFNSSNDTIDNFRKTLNQTYSTAVGPFIGFEYRFSLYTEGGIYLDFIYKHITVKTHNPLFGTKITSLNMKTDINFPTSITLFYSF